MTVLKEESGRWSLEVPPFDVQPVKGMTISVAPSNFTPPRKHDAPVQCKVLDWTWTIDASRAASLEIKVKEVHLPWVDRALKTDQARFIASLLANLALILLMRIAYSVVRQSPESAWAFMGRHVRTTIGWAIFLLFWLGIPLTMRWHRSSGFSGYFKQSLSLFTGFVLVGCWLYVSRIVPGSNVSEANYARGLVYQFVHSFWPVILAGLPWLLALFKMFGVERAEKTTSALLEAGKKRKE